MKIKKLLCFLTAAVLTLTVCGCRENTADVSSGISSSSADESVSMRNYITLLYSAADSFNPYTLKTDVNRQLCKLLYEPLVKVSNEFKATKALAKSVVTKGKTCTVTLRSAKFSDGTTVTAEDVKYSYNLAKKSGTTYGKKLYGVSSVSASGSKIVFKLKTYDPYFENVLDFPIIKRASDKKTDSDSVALPPVGCGRYRLNANRNGLVINSRYFGEKGKIKTVRLINAPDSESVSHYAEIGAADMYFSEISDGNIMRMSGTRQEINLNNLVYIGINQNYAPLDKKPLRQAISTALNRIKICEEAYYNNAVAATGVFHPEWEEAKSVQNIQIEADNEITVENLKEIGYNKLNSDGIRVNSNGIPLKFTLLVNSENRIRVLAANTVAEQLKSAGIKITVVEKSYKKYKAALKKGDFQLYIGEVKFTDNMDVSSLFVKGGSAAYGLPKKAQKEEGKENSSSSASSSSKATDVKTASQKVIEEYKKGKTTIRDVAAVLQSEMCVVPLCYRTGVLFYNDKIENVNNSSLSDIYFSINSYLIN